MNKTEAIAAYVSAQKKSKKPINTLFNAGRLAQCMIDRRMNTQTTLQVAVEQCGVPLTTFYRAEAASGKIDMVNLVKISNWLETPIQSFFSWLKK